MILNIAAPQLLKGETQTQGRDASKRLSSVIFPELRQKYIDVVDISEKSSGNLEADRNELTRSLLELAKFGVLSLSSLGINDDDLIIESIDLKGSLSDLITDDTSGGVITRSSGLSEPQDLQLQPPTPYVTRPRPEKFRILNLSTASIAELLIKNHRSFSSLARSDDLGARLFNAAKHEFLLSFLDNPLMIKGGDNFSRIGRTDLSDLFLHIDFHGGNTNATRYRSALESEVNECRSRHKADLSRVHPSAFLEHSFPESQTIFEWFRKPPPSPKKLTVEEKKTIDFIKEKKASWRALRLQRAMAKAQSPLDKRQIEKDMRHRFEKLDRLLRSRQSCVKRINIEEPRVIKSMFDICPSNGHLSLSDTSAAHFRHLTAEGTMNSYLICVEVYRTPRE
jgi:hypothetical protein